jgi:hypothetical protein
MERWEYEQLVSILKEIKRIFLEVLDNKIPQAKLDIYTFIIVVEAMIWHYELDAREAVNTEEEC